MAARAGQPKKKVSRCQRRPRGGKAAGVAARCTSRSGRPQRGAARDGSAASCSSPNGKPARRTPQNQKRVPAVSAPQTPVAKPLYRVPSMAEIAAIPDSGYRAISLFAGCGGSCLGYRMAGIKVIWANEFIPAARETYAANRPGAIDDAPNVVPLTWPVVRGQCHVHASLRVHSILLGRHILSRDRERLGATSQAASLRKGPLNPVATAAEARLLRGA